MYGLSNDFVLTGYDVKIGKISSAATDENTTWSVIEIFAPNLSAELNFVLSDDPKSYQQDGRYHLVLPVAMYLPTLGLLASGKAVGLSIVAVEDPASASTEKKEVSTFNLCLVNAPPTTE